MRDAMVICPHCKEFFDAEDALENCPSCDKLHKMKELKDCDGCGALCCPDEKFVMCEYCEDNLCQDCIEPDEKICMECKDG